jgi:hypothetical protein
MSTAIMSEKARVIGQFNDLSEDKKLKMISQMMGQMKKSRPLVGIELLYKSRMAIPLGIFSQEKLSCLEAMVKYLKEERSMRLGAIAKLLNRDNRTIWSTYSHASQKMPEPLKGEGPLMMPSLIADREFTVLEHVVMFAKSLGFTNHEVALHLMLDDRTIWSVYNNVKKKRGNHGH